MSLEERECRASERAPVPARQGEPDERDLRIRELEARVAALEAERASEASRLQVATAMELLQALDRPAVFQLLAERIHSVAGGAFVALSEFNPRALELTVRAVHCTPEARLRAVEVLGRDPVGLSLPFPAEVRKRWRAGELAPVPGGLHELFFRQVPAPVCQRLERELGLGDVFGMGCVYEEDILGSVAVVTRGRGTPRNQKVIEALVAQAALALKRLRAEDARLETEERFRRLFESASDGILILALDGALRDVNDAYCAMSGYARGELQGSHLSRLEAVESAKGIAEHIDRLLRSGGRDHFQSKHRRKDGSFFDVEVTAAHLDREGGRIAVIARDVTERLRSEAALRESEARFALLSRTAGRLLAAEEPQTVVNDLCRDVMVHLDCQAFFNFLVDEGRGKLRLNACAGIPDEEAHRIRWLDFGIAVCGCVARDRQRIIAEDVQRSEDRRTELIRSYGIQAYCCHPLLDAGRLIGTLSFGTRSRPRFTSDEVELMRRVADQVAAAMQRLAAKRALSAANARLLEADRRKDSFLAVLSHELRNPLAPIANSLSILERAAPGGDQARRAQAVIGRQVAQLARLVDDLLDVTRITRNKITLRREPLELNELVHRVVEDHRSTFEKAEVSLELTRADGPVSVNGDRNRLAQAIGNLLQNAAKFTGPGGAARVSVAADPAQGLAVVRVADDGVGMGPEMLRRLFEPFAQADQALDRSKGGLGLGLALVKGMVELHGGEVTASSRGPGQGAEFVVSLPLDGAEAFAAAPPPTSERTGRRILILEEDRDAADSLGEALELSGHRVAVEHSGPEGLKKAQQFLPDVVLCGVGLPGMDGYLVARALRAHGALKGAFLVALGGEGSSEEQRMASEAGFDRYLAKPASLEALAALLAGAPAEERLAV